jgi:sodium/proline symporter
MKLVIMILYIIAILVIGVIAQTGRFRIKDEEDFDLSGREHGWFAIGASAFASGCSAFAFIGMAGLAYKVGIAMIWYSLLATTWSWATFFVFGRRLRIASEKTGSLTMLDYIGERFEDDKGILRLIGAVVIIIFMVGYLASQFTGMAKAFQGFLNWPFLVSMFIGAGIMMLYTFMSGFRAVVWTDVLQACIMIVGSLVLMIVAVAKAGGMGDFMSKVAAIDPRLASPTGGKVGIAFATFLLAWVGSGMMGLGNPHVVVRPMAIKDPRGLRQGGIFALVANMWVMYLGVFAGLAARVYLPEMTDVDLAYSTVVGTLMGPVIGGLIIAGIIASSMSTGDSQLMVASTEFSRNIYGRHINRDASETTRVWVTRFAVIAVGLIGIVFTLTSKQLVFWMVLFAWAGLGCAFGPLLFLALFWKRTTWAGAMAGIIAGTLTVIIWNQTPVLKRFIYEGVPGFIVAFIAVIVESFLTSPPKKAVELQFGSESSSTE